MSESRHIWIGDPLVAMHARPDEHDVIASARVARTSGVRAVALRSRAHARLREHGWSIASALVAWRSLGSAVRDEVGASDTAAWRRALSGPVSELLAAGVANPIGTTPDIPSGVANGTRRAWRVAERHAGRLAAARRVDEAALLAVATSIDPMRSGSEAAARPWFVVAPTGLSEVEMRWVANAAPSGSIVVLPPEATDAIGRLRAHGFAVDRQRPAAAAEIGIDRPSSARTTVAYRFASSDEEIRWMLAHARDVDDAGPESNTPSRSPAALVVADPAAQAPQLEAIAWELGVPIRIERPMALRATGIGGFLAAAVETIGRDLPYEPTLHLLQHRLAGGMDTTAYATARSTRPAGPTAWQAVDRRSGALTWPREATRRRFRDLLDATLDAFELPRDDLPLHENAALHLVVRGLQEDGDPNDGGPKDENIDRQTFLSDVTELLALLSVRAPALRGDAASDEPVLPVVTPRQAAEMQVDRLSFLGFAEGLVPAHLTDAAVLDAHDRDRLRAVGIVLPDAGERARAAWRDVAAALRAPRLAALLGVPSRSGGAALLPSPYLERLGLEPVAAPPRTSASPEEWRRVALQSAARPDGGAAAAVDDPVLDSAVRSWRIERRRESAGPPDRFDGHAGRPLVLDGPDGWQFSATSLLTLGQCGFRFFARYRLGLESFDERDERITPQLRGKLWHAALERAVARVLPVPDGVEVGAELRAKIGALVPEAYAAAERANAVPDADGEAWQRIRAGEIQALERFVQSDDFLAPDGTPRAVEMHFEGSWRGLAVRGIVDRVDERADGVELIDYKSGTTKPKGALADDRRSWIDVQLPLYVEAAAPHLAGELDVPTGRIRARYLSIRDGRTLLTVEPGQQDAPLDELVGRVRRISDAGAWHVDPDPRREVCRTCDFALVCRVGPRIDRKRDAPSEPRPGAGS